MGTPKPSRLKKLKLFRIFAMTIDFAAIELLLVNMLHQSRSMTNMRNGKQNIATYYVS